MDEELNVGDRVRVTSGGWAGHYGRVVGVRGALVDIRYEAPVPEGIPHGAYDRRNFVRDSHAR